MDWVDRCDTGVFKLKAFDFAAGGRADLRLAYRTLGTMNEDRSNAVLLLHGTVGSGLQFLRPAFADALFSPGCPLDINRYFIVLPDAIGHGGSSKPSDDPNSPFPRYGYFDIVNAQHSLVVDGLQLARLRLVMGSSMGGMQTWMWGARYPDMMDALLPVASLPERITGRNLLWRRLLLQISLLDEAGGQGAPPVGLGLAWVLFQMMGASPARLAERLTTQEAADDYIKSVAADALAREKLLDVVAEFEASGDFDVSADLHRIKAPLLALNFIDDDINPVALGALERAVGATPNGEFVLFSAGDKSEGHQSLTLPELWKHHILELLRRSRAQTEIVVS